MNERIKKLREHLGMSRAVFGAQLGISGDVVNNLERGRVEAKDDRIKLICSVFGVNEEWLRTGNGEMYRYTDTDDYTEITAIIGENDPKAKQAIMDYWKLSEDDKKLFWQFAEKFLRAGD